jgi:hypothetical protein
MSSPLATAITRAKITKPHHVNLPDSSSQPLQPGEFCAMRRSEKRKGGREGRIDSSTTSWLPPFLPSCPIESGSLVSPLGIEREGLAMEMGEKVGTSLRISSPASTTQHQLPSINYPASIPSTNYPAPVTQHQLPSTNYPAPITQHHIPSVNYPASITQHHIPSVNYPASITQDYWLPTVIPPLPTPITLNQTRKQANPHLT